MAEWGRDDGEGKIMEGKMMGRGEGLGSDWSDEPDDSDGSAGELRSQDLEISNGKWEMAGAAALACLGLRAANSRGLTSSRFGS